MTHQQRRTLANLVLAHGYDNLCEFWGELTHNCDDFITLDEAQPVLFAWHKQLIALADKA